VKESIFAASSRPTVKRLRSQVETMQPQPISPMAVTEVTSVNCTDKLRAVVTVSENFALRYLTFLAPADPARPIPACLPKFCTGPGRDAARGLRDGEQTRDFTFVENACSQPSCCEAPNASGKVFNVGTRAHLSDKVSQGARKITGKTSKPSTTRRATRYP